MGRAAREGAREARDGEVNERRLPFESYGVSHRGCVRELNEDSYIVEPRLGLWAVADGMGGHEAGEIASASIIHHLATIGFASSAPDLRARFEDRLGKAHAEIRKLSLMRGVTIGSTVVALLARDGNFACLWSGDSRIYLVRRGAITQVSKDHTEVQDLLDRGMITAEEARNWPRRNVITRAIGVSDEIAVDFQQGELLPGDVFILASDGLTAHVSDAEIAAAAALSPQGGCEDLLSKVLARGGTDNVTIVLVRIGDSRNGSATGMKAWAP